MNRSSKGFSLLELLIVVAIILIIATIAIPSLLKSRQAAHEAAAVSTLRTINTAEVTYLTTANGKFGSLQDLVNNNMISSNFIPGPVSGYFFNISLGAGNSDYTITAEPASANDGKYGYYVTLDNTVRYSIIATLAPAGSSGAPVNQ